MLKVESIVFLVFLFLVVFASADILDDIIDVGLDDVEILNESEVFDYSLCKGDDDCVLEMQQREIGVVLGNFEEVDCEGDSLCEVLKQNRLNELEFENISGEFRGGGEGDFYSESGNLRSVEYFSDDIRKAIQLDTKRRKLDFFERFIVWVKRIKDSFTGNVVSRVDDIDLPDLPGIPGDYGEVYVPKLSDGTFKIFNFLTGNAIIGIPDWSFDGTDTVRGNFIFEADYTSMQASLQHFDLVFDINFSKEDNEGRSPVNGVIYNEGYYLNVRGGEWTSFNWDGTEVWSRDFDEQNVFTGWLRAGINGQPKPSASLTLDDYSDDDYAIFLGYSCVKFSEQTWECNEGKWVIFVVETGDVDYHSDIGDVPRLEFIEVADLDVSDIPSILEQFEVNFIDFQPELNDLFITELNEDVEGDVGSISELNFYVKNFGNRDIENIDYELDIGEASLVEVVSVDLPVSLVVGEGAYGKIFLYFKEEHRQKITLFGRTSLEVDSSDNLAEFEISVGDSVNLDSVLAKVAYHGDTGKIISVNRESFTRVVFNDNLEVISGTDKVRTIYGGEWEERSINPTMNVHVVPLVSEEALFSRPFVDSIMVTGDMLTGDTEIVNFKVRLINERTGVYYETPELEAMYRYFFNPKELIPDFEFCTNYIIETILTGGNQETIDVINPEPFNLCDFKQVGGSFRTERLLKQDGDYVVIIPRFSRKYYEDLNINYFIEFEDISDVDRIYRTRKFIIADGVQIVPIVDIFGDRIIYYSDSGTIFDGRVVLLDSLQVAKRDCLAQYDSVYFSGFSDIVGLENWRQLGEEGTFDFKEIGDMFLCYDDVFYQCGEITSINYGNLSLNKISLDESIGSWKCNGDFWVFEGQDGVDIGGVEERVENFTYEKIIVNKSDSGYLIVFNKGDLPIVDGRFDFVEEPQIRAAYGVDLEELMDAHFSSFLDSGINIEGLEYGDYYFICFGCVLDLENKTFSEERSFREAGDSSLVFKWRDWDIVTMLNVRLTLQDGFIFFDSRNSFYTISPFSSIKKGDAYLRYPEYMSDSLRKAIFNETIFELMIYDLTDNKVFLERTIYGYNNSLLWHRISLSDHMDLLENGHFYQLYLTISSPNSKLYKTLDQRLFYIDGYNFILNNQLLYSRFYGLQNFPSSVNSWVGDADGEDVDSENVGYVQVDYYSSNIQYNSCTGAYEKINDTRRFVDVVGECSYPDTEFVYFEGSREPLFESLSIKMVPVDGTSIGTPRSAFNCKIGRFDGICLRSNFGLSFNFLDNRTKLMYQINLGSRGQRFLKKYRDASNNSAGGNAYDLVLYDILTQIDRYPIETFDLDYKYKLVEVVDDTMWALGPYWVAYFYRFFDEDRTLLTYGDWEWNRNDYVLNVYNSSFDLIDTIRYVDVASLYNDLFMNYILPLNLFDGEYYVQENSSTTFKNFYLEGFFTYKFIWINDAVSWFFSRSDVSVFSDVPNGLNVAYRFFDSPIHKNSNRWGEPSHFWFSFVLDPVNWTTGNFSLNEYGESLDYYFCTDCSSEGNELSTKKLERKREVARRLSPSVVDFNGGISRFYQVKARQYNDIYEFFNGAPHNCNNRYNSSDSNLRDVVCSSHVYGGFSGESPVFRFSCSWSNIDELKVYTINMDQRFENRGVDNVNNLPVEVIKDMRDNYFHPVLLHYLDALPPTPILDTIYGSINAYDTCN